MKVVKDLNTQSLAMTNMNKFDLTYNGVPINRCELNNKIYTMDNTPESDIKRIYFKNHYFHIGKEKIEIIENSELLCINDICGRSPSNNIRFFYE